ncbi:acyl-CoA dehydrogenase [Herbiconiux sp.]|uniref:acyl-CoA dehydrogenase n=1 Tax=Herbiconiux sp. TaxID=1871186 RepID=UPI0025C0C2E8|nr:acyl-CoA dehydrogenase [Herbiconiux sp.]
MRPGAVTLDPGRLRSLLAPVAPVAPALHELDEVFDEAVRARAEVGLALELATRVARGIPRPGHGSTARYLETLATLAAADVTVARVVEPHLDAAMILAECPAPVDLRGVGADASSTWGVFAAEGPGVRLTATPTPDASGWLLDGTKPWCSLAGRLTHALVTAHVAADGAGWPDATDGADATERSAAVGGGRRLFAVDLRHDGVTAQEDAWVARGFPSVPSGPTDFARVPAVAVGATGWYLGRAGFEWGGIGVAACWFGGAVGVARRVVQAAAERGDDIALLHAGRVALAVQSAASALAAAAAAMDQAVMDQAAMDPAAMDAAAVHAAAADAAAVDPTGGSTAVAGDTAGEAALLAQVTRSIVRAAAEDVLREAAHALGPSPLALDADYAARVADLELYLRQDHGTRDEARVGRLLTALAGPPVVASVVEEPASEVASLEEASLGKASRGEASRGDTVEASTGEASTGEASTAEPSLAEWANTPWAFEEPPAAAAGPAAASQRGLRP